MSANQFKSEVERIFALQKKNKWLLKATTANERKEKLRRLRDKIFAISEQLYDVLYQDYRKPAEETDILEVLPTITEINEAVKHLGDWMRPRTVDTPIHLGTGRSEIRYESLGQSLIIAPWNYPFYLSMAPLVSAISAGNTVILKPSEFAPRTAEFVKQILAEIFPEEEVAVFNGDSEVSQLLLKLPFDHMFFTGSPAVGKIVMRAAAEHLSAVTLELGGKSPAIIDDSADVRDAATKIAWGKFVNAGQTCIAPDYLLVSESRKQAVVDGIRDTLHKFYGFDENTWIQSPDFCRIVNEKHYKRIKGLIDGALEGGAKLEIGGKFDDKQNYISPTIISNVPQNAKILQEEIFGPVLPIVTYNSLDEAIEYVRAGHKPLALYAFSGIDSVTERILSGTAAGGSCVNDVVVQAANPRLPFGGSNNSGLGNYHGIFGFKAFSHERAVFRQSRLFNPMSLFYPPYEGQFRDAMQKLIRHFL